MYETDYEDYGFQIAEAKPTHNLVNIRKLQYNSIEFKGIVGKIMNRDPNNDSYIVTKEFYSVYFVSKLNLLNQIVIYTDVIEEQYYGGQQRQVLHTLQITPNTAPIIDSPHYVTVNKSVVNSINIRIYDRAGEPIKFLDLFSNVLVKLHFRKK